MTPFYKLLSPNPLLLKILTSHIWSVDKAREHVYLSSCTNIQKSFQEEEWMNGIQYHK